MLQGVYCADLLPFEPFLLSDSSDIEIVDQAEDNADGQEQAKDSVPWGPCSPRIPADKNKNQVGQANFIGQSVEQGHDCPDQDGTGLRRLAEMKEKIGKKCEGKGKFFAKRFHMNHRAVIFPDTFPSERLLIPLVQVFDQLVYFQPVENDAVGTALRTPFIEAMVDDDRCRFAAPAPLGDNRDKFNHLVDDIRNRRADYGVQLAHASLASIPSLARPAKESKSSLISDLLAAKGIQDKEDDRNTEILWQARLVLKLAEIFDADQASLRRDLDALHSREKNLLGELRKEESDLFSLTGKLATVSPVTDEMIQMRLKAWARLCAQGRADLLDNSILLTGSWDGFDMLVEAFEEIAGRIPVRMGSLSLPADCSSGENLLRQHRLFREETKGLLNEFFLGLESRKEVSALSVETAWDILLERFFPAASFGRARMRLIYCPGISAKDLVAAAFLHESMSAATLLDDGAGVFIGLLERI